MKFRTIIDSKSKGRLLVELIGDDIKIMDSNFNEVKLTEAEVAKIKAILAYELKYSSLKAGFY